MGGWRKGAANECMQIRKTGAIGVDGEHRAIFVSAARPRRPEQGVADKTNPACGSALLS